LTSLVRVGAESFTSVPDVGPNLTGIMEPAVANVSFPRLPKSLPATLGRW
jgi:hypothetical protein